MGKLGQSGNNRNSPSPSQTAPLYLKLYSDFKAIVDKSGHMAIAEVHPIASQIRDVRK